VRDAAVGLLLTAAVTGVLWIAWGWVGVPPGLVFGGLATVLHVLAVALLRSALDAPFGKLMLRWVGGMALRLAGVVVFALAVLTKESLFPALPTAIAYLGVLLPLMATEMNLLRKRLG